jgi:uncharacterized RDD family membrane protein YckC
MPPPSPPRAFLVQGDDGEEYGPVDPSELRQWVRENRAGLGTMVRAEGPHSPWLPWQEFPELVALLAEVRSTGRPPVREPAQIVAPIGRRMIALGIDLILAYLPIYIIIWVIMITLLPDIFVQCDVFAQLMLTSSQTQVPLPQFPPLYDVLFRLLIYGGVALYMAGFHAAHGRTPGKSILRLHVVDENGDKPTLAKALVRGLVLSFSLALFFVPLMYVFFNPQRRALHDLAAGTFVVEA